LIAREENPTDRRESFLHLTVAGRNRLKRFRGHVAAKYTEKIALISPAKKKLLAEALPLIGEEITAL
jgi:DNA-binding MarR family transcriptional regulator